MTDNIKEEIEDKIKLDGKEIDLTSKSAIDDYIKDEELNEEIKLTEEIIDYINNMEVQNVPSI